MNYIREKIFIQKYFRQKMKIRENKIFRKFRKTLNFLNKLVFSENSYSILEEKRYSYVLIYNKYTINSIDISILIHSQINNQKLHYSLLSNYIND